jgi:hypothetical protein
MNFENVGDKWIRSDYFETGMFNVEETVPSSSTLLWVGCPASCNMMLLKSPIYSRH